MIDVNDVPRFFLHVILRIAIRLEWTGAIHLLMPIAMRSAWAAACSKQVQAPDNALAGHGKFRASAKRNPAGHEGRRGAELAAAHDSSGWAVGSGNR